jgi:diamine N-acetyltransferase
MTSLGGSCACGAVRYRLEAWLDAGFCHCARCRRWSGAPVMAWAQVAPGALVVDGTPARWQARSFCSTCGTSLWASHHEHDWLCLGTLDEPAAIRPAVHLCVEDQVAWLKLADYLPTIEGRATVPPPPASRKPIRRPVDRSVGRGATLALVPVSETNLRDVLLADVTGAQRRLVATNAISLAQAAVVPGVWTRAIQAGDTVVGFAMARRFPADEYGLSCAGDPYLWRFMIDEGYQGLGLGQRALELIVAELRSWPGSRAVWLSCVPGEGSALALYQRVGFVDTGAVDEDDEHLMRLAI